MKSAVVLAVILLTPTVGQAQQNGEANAWEFLAEKYDENMDGKLSEDEYERGAEAFARLDRNKDGFLTKDDWAKARRPVRRKDDQWPANERVGVAPKKGELAPDFELPNVKDSAKTVRLSGFTGKKPVALVFGSYT